MEKLGQNNIYSQFLGQYPILRTYKGTDLINEYKPLYTPPVDWSDIRVDCPENSIALYAGESGTRDYTFSGKSQVGYTVTGSPTITGGVVSGFSSSDYLNISSFPNLNVDFTSQVVFASNVASQVAGLFCGTSWNYNGWHLVSGALYFSLRVSDGENSQIIRSIFATQLLSGTSYKAVANRVGNNVVCSLYLGNTKIEEQSFQVDTGYNVVQDINYRVGYSAPGAFDGSIDLNETYIKVNNEYWFNGAAKLTGASDSLYLENDGSERYIDTGILLNNNCKIEATCALSSSALTADHGWRLAGSYYDSAGFGLGTGSANQNPLFRYAAQAPSLADYNMKDTNKHTLVLDKENAYFDGTLVHTFVPTTFQNTGTNTAGIFSRRQSSNQDYWNGKIYRCRFWDDTSTLVGDFVPVPAGFVAGSVYCPTNGMFDLVKQKFYSNQGTGNFTYGRDGDALSYNNLGFTATCVGGYNVFIDGEHYGTYDSASQCNIIWSQSGANGGDDITTPSALKAHKIWISPATEGNNITKFSCSKVASSGRERQGVLWAHFNIDNVINLEYSFAIYNGYYQPLMLALTAKNNLINCSKLPQFGQTSDLAIYASNIEYTPTFDLNNNTINGAQGLSNLLQTAELKKIVIKNGSITGSIASFSHNATKLKKIITKNVNIIPTVCENAFRNNLSLEELPDIDYSNATRMGYYLTNAVALKDTVLDVSAAKGLTTIGCYGNSTYFMSGFKGLRVSNEAPFNGTSPQINVNYTGMNRNALVQLFNDLPYNVGYTVVGNPTINNGVVSGFSSSDYLKLPKVDNNDTTYSNFEIQIKFKTSSQSDQSAKGNTYIGLFSVYRSSDSKVAQWLELYYGGSSGCSVWYQYNDITDPSNPDRRQIQLKNNGSGIYVSWDTSYIYKVSCVNGDCVARIYTENGTLVGEAIIPYKTAYLQQNGWGLAQFGIYNGSYAFAGSIDLNETYIKVNDVYWFRGQPAMTKTLSCVGATGNQDKLTIVGSPTIENGVVSDFIQNTNYLTINTSILSSTDKFEIVEKAACNIITTATSGAIPLFYGGPNFYAWVSSGNRNITVKISNSDNAQSFSLPSSFNIDDYFRYKIVIENNSYTVYFAEATGDFTSIGSAQLTSSPNYPATLILGNNAQYWTSGTTFKSAIDLNETYIKVNNELWFGREQYLLPEDKAIAEDKGWALTLTA